MCEPLKIKIFDTTKIEFFRTWILIATKRVDFLADEGNHIAIWDSSQLSRYAEEDNSESGHRFLTWQAVQSSVMCTYFFHGYQNHEFFNTGNTQKCAIFAWNNL